MKRTKRMIAISMAAAMLFPTTAFAGTWQGADGSYKYQNDDGTYVKGGWHWIDGNGDGVSESYYFNEDGMLLQNTTTPDNYQVDASGAWVVDGVVQTKIVGASAVTDMSQRNEEAPLAHLADNFVVDPYGGYLQWKWSTDYQMTTNPALADTWVEKYHHTGIGELLGVHALEVDNPGLSGGYQSHDLLILANLAGVEPGPSDANYIKANITTLTALQNEVTEFMNSFDWRNASDFEKAVKISERLAEADYYDDTTYGTNDLGQETISWGNASNSIGCLIDGKCNCDGYSSAADLLATCVGLPHTLDIIGNHGFPIYRINGVWVRHEPTTKDRFFRVFDWKESMYGPNKEYYSGIAEFCERSGYVTPTNEEAMAAFPGKAHQVSENKVIIYFD